MHRSEPATADNSHAELEKTLRDGAALKPSEYSPTVLGLIFLRYADVRFANLPPKSYHIPQSRTLSSLLKTMASISMGKGEALRANAGELQARIAENVTELLAA